MDDLATILSLLGLTAFAVAVFSFFKPLPKLRLATRKASGVLAALSVGSCVAGGALLPTPPVAPEESTQVEALAPIEASTAQVEQEANAMWAQVVAISRSCDATAKAAAGSLDELSAGKISVYAAYDAVTQAERACKRAAREMALIELPPSTTGKTKAGFRGTVAVCTRAYEDKAAAFTQALTVLNGDSSPASVQKFKDAVSASLAGNLYCAGAFIDAAKVAGVPTENLKLEG